MYFEDYVVDAVTISRGRTITEADIVNFAGLSGDFVELHMNDEYAKRGPFGKRIAHGALIFSISTGLMVQMTGDHAKRSSRSTASTNCASSGPCSSATRFIVTRRVVGKAVEERRARRGRV